jgi:hypothetical protein
MGDSKHHEEKDMLHKFGWILLSSLLVLTMVGCANRENDAKSESPSSSEVSHLENSSAIVAENPSSESVDMLPEEDSSSESVDTLPPEDPSAAFAKELRYARYDELVDALNRSLSRHRSGTYEGMPNHHSPYPEDFPPVENLPVIDGEEDFAIVWRESVQIDEKTERLGAVYIIVPIDETHVYFLEPALFHDIEEEATLGFGGSGFADMSLEEFIAHSETTTF